MDKLKVLTHLLAFRFRDLKYATFHISFTKINAFYQFSYTKNTEKLHMHENLYEHIIYKNSNEKCMRIIEKFKKNIKCFKQ